jgi:hypothetical protein
VTALLRLGALEIALDERVGMEVDVIDIRKASSLLRAEVFRSGRVVHAPDEASLRALRGAPRGSPKGR